MQYVYVNIYTYLDIAKWEGSKTPHARDSDSKVLNCTKHCLFLTLHDFVSFCSKLIQQLR